jgi:hypothetical protein
VQVLDGEDASGFVRYRQTQRGDFDRLDRVKVLAHALLARVRELHVGTITRLPALVDTFFDDVETNASPALVRELLPRIPRLRIQAATLPVIELEDDTRLLVDRLTVDRFLAETFGGTARTLAEAPDATLHVVNRSGREGLEERYAERLIAMGVPAETLVLSSAPPSTRPRRASWRRRRTGSTPTSTPTCSTSASSRSIGSPPPSGARWACSSSWATTPRSPVRVRSPHGS